MGESIHGHRVLEMISDLDRTASRQELESLIAGTFGAEARFHTCSRENMEIVELLDFLFERGKLSLTDNHIQVQAGQVCSDK